MLYERSELVATLGTTAGRSVGRMFGAGQRPRPQRPKPNGVRITENAPLRRGVRDLAPGVVSASDTGIENQYGFFGRGNLV
jgi:hypothetical protein